MKYCRWLILVAAFAVMGCAHMHVVCQDAGTTTLAVGGNTVGQQLLTAGLAAAKTAGFMAVAPPEKGAAPTAQAQSFVDYNYMPVFGPDYASCSTNPPPTPPSTSIVMMQPNGAAPEIITVPAGQVVVSPQLK